MLEIFIFIFSSSSLIPIFPLIFLLLYFSRFLVLHFSFFLTWGFRIRKLRFYFQNVHREEIHSSNYYLRTSTEKAPRPLAPPLMEEDRPFSSPQSRLDHASIQAAINSLPMDDAPLAASFSKISTKAIPSKSTLPPKLDPEILILQTRQQSTDRKLGHISDEVKRIVKAHENQTKFNDHMESRFEAHAETSKELLFKLSEQVQALTSRFNERLAPDSFKSPTTARTTEKVNGKTFSLAPVESDEEDLPSPKVPTINTGRFYAVYKGRYGNAIYNTWEACHKAVDGVSGVKHQKFASEDSAEEFIFNNEQARITKKKSPLNPSSSPKKPTLKVETQGTFTNKFSSTRPTAPRNSDGSGDEDSLNSSVSGTTLGGSQHSTKRSDNSALKDSQTLHCIREASFYEYYQPTDNGSLVLPTLDIAVSLSESNIGFTILCPNGNLYYVVPLSSASTKDRKLVQNKQIQVRISNPDAKEIIGGYTRPVEASRDPSHLFPSSWLACDEYFTLMAKYIQDHFYSVCTKEAEPEERDEAARKRVEVTRQFETFRFYIRSLIEFYILSPEYLSTQVVSWAHILLFIHNIMNRFFANGMIPEHLNALEFQEQWSVYYKSQIQRPYNRSVANLRVSLEFLQCYCPYCGASGSTKEFCSAIVCTGSATREAANKLQNERSAAPLKVWQEAHAKAKAAPGYTSYDAYCKAHPKPSVKVDSSDADYASMQHRLTLRPVVASRRADTH